MTLNRLRSPLKTIAVCMSLMSLLAGCATSTLRAPSTSTSTLTPTQQNTPWAQATARDLNAIYQLLLANHPGAIDPERATFRQWLDTGYREGLIEAQAATTEAQYVNAIRRYINGFRDGHMSVVFPGMTEANWPGFLAAENHRGELRVTVASATSPLPIGAVITDCNGIASRKLVDKLVSPYRLNEDIPHERAAKSVFTFVARPDDPERPSACRYQTETMTSTVALQWQNIDAALLSGHLSLANGEQSRGFGIRALGDIVVISIPTFNLFADRAKPIQELIKQIQADLASLRRARFVVIDVRGNGGGNSTWGEQIAKALYGHEIVEPIVKSFDWTVDWRVSQRNIDAMRANAARSTASGLIDAAAVQADIATQMEAALNRGDVFYRQSRPGTAITSDRIASPLAAMSIS